MSATHHCYSIKRESFLLEARGMLFVQEKALLFTFSVSFACGRTPDTRYVDACAWCNTDTTARGGPLNFHVQVAVQSNNGGKYSCPVGHVRNKVCALVCTWLSQQAYPRPNSHGHRRNISIGQGLQCRGLCSGAPLPERTPSNVALAQVLMRRRLLD